MSIALDTALYLREQKQDNPLSVAERGVLFTLMFRVGSNPFSWISQESLAIELDITERNVRRFMANLKVKGYVSIQKDPNDKRKNLYRPAEFLINYHQQSNRKSTKEYRSKLTGKMEDIGQNRPVNTGQNRPLLNSESINQTIDNKEYSKTKISPKEHIKEHILNKREEIELPLWIKKEDWNDYILHRKEMKEPMSFVAQKRALTELSKLKDQGHDPSEVINQTIINNWKGLFALKNNQKHVNQQNNQTKEIKSTVMEYGPGHPLWEQNKNWKGVTSHGSETRRDYFGGNGMRKAKDYLL